ncbi:MAG: BACON domain-containing protein [Prevotella sp.]|nr:BACON domain-containing protein [Prevotella sp.]
MLLACQDGNDFSQSYTPSLEAHYLHLPANTIAMPASGEAKKLQVEAQDTPWQFSGMASWLNIDPATGSGNSTSTVTATENTSADTVRTSTVLFASTLNTYPYSNRLTVTQDKATPHITPSTGALTFSQGAATQQFTVAANVTWTLETPAAAWLTLRRDGNTVTVAVAENQSLTPREATLYLAGGAVRTSVTVTQQGAAQPVVSDESLLFQNNGGTARINLTTEVAWTATISDGATAWLTVGPTEGQAGTTALVVQAMPNATTDVRSGHVYVLFGQNRVLDIPVEQQASYLRLTGQLRSFAAAAESQQLTVEGNSSWQLTEKPAWLTVSPTAADGSATLTLTAADNWSLSQRSGVLRIGREGTTLAAELTVTQQGRHFDDLISSLSFTDQAGTQTVELSTDGQWTATTSDPSWLGVAPASGTGNTLLTVTVAENNTDGERDGFVTVSVDGTAKTIAVTQQGKYFTIAPTDLAELPSTGGTHSLHIATNEAWTSQSSSTWMVVSARQGQGDIDVTLTAPDNASAQARRDTTTFAPQHLQPVRVVTRQAARYLTLGTDALTFTGRAATQQVGVQTDGTFTATSSDTDWCTVGCEQGSVAIAVTENSGSTEREATVTVSMTGLRAGETLSRHIRVSQRPLGIAANLDGYGDEQQWDIYVGTDFTVTVTPYGSEQSWD